MGMRNHLAISCPVHPADISDADLIDELAEQLVAGRQDPSDVEACSRFLVDLDICRPMRLGDVLDRAMDVAGQIYINRECNRKTG